MLTPTEPGRGGRPRRLLAVTPEGLSALKGAGAAWGSLLHDVTYAVRTLVREPGWTAATLATLTLGIGATAAIFAVVHGVLLRPLDFPSLEPHWVSTMMGPWFFMGAFWGGIASTGLWSLHLRTKDKDVSNHIGLQQRHDLGKLAFAFTVFWTYLFFAQYLVIWYGKLPEEQSWIIHRSVGAWGAYSTAVVLMCFVVPFAGLIGRKAKMKPVILGVLTFEILLALWLERYGMVAPALWHEGQPIFTIWQPLIGFMFLGLYLGAVRWFLSTFPVIQLWQPMVDPESLEAELPQGQTGAVAGD